MSDVQEINNDAFQVHSVDDKGTYVVLRDGIFLCTIRPTGIYGHTAHFTSGSSVYRVGLAGLMSIIRHWQKREVRTQQSQFPTTREGSALDV